MAGIDNIADIVAFVRIISAGSLSAAARDLDLSLAAVSKRLIRLEQALDARLINRTTRQLSLTPEGEVFHAHCLELLEQVRRAEEAISSQRENVSGLIRITASSTFARRQITPTLGPFLDRYPRVRFDVIATDDIVDIVKDGVDIAIRQRAELPDSGLVSRVIAPDRRVVCAAPAYLDRYGAPGTPEDLLTHRCIVFGSPPITTWCFSRDGETRDIEIDWSIHVTSGDAAYTAVLGGAGIVAKSIWEVAEDIRKGRLVQLLSPWKTPDRPIHVIYPSVRYKTPRIGAFVDFLATELKEAARKQGL